MIPVHIQINTGKPDANTNKCNTKKKEVRVGTLERTVCSSPKMDGNFFATESVASHHSKTRHSI